MVQPGRTDNVRCLGALVRISAILVGIALTNRTSICKRERLTEITGNRYESSAAARDRDDGLIRLLAATINRHWTLGRERLYRLPTEQALAIAHTAILRAFPGRRIETIDGPIRGYSTYTRVMLDTFTQQVLVIPMQGTTPSGQMVQGYTFEVSGSGSSGTGAMRNDAFFNALQGDLDRTGTAVEVTELQQRAAPKT